MSMKNFVTGALCCMIAVSVTAAQAVVINEFWADDNSSDTNEFVELFGTPSASLSGLSLIVVDGDTGGSTTSSNFRRVTYQFDFTTESLGLDGFFMVGGGPDITVDQSESVGFLQNGSQTYALVQTSDIAFDVSDTDELTQASVDAIAANLIDAVATTDGSTGDNVYFGAPDITSASNFAADTAQRVPNGVDTDSTGDWFEEPFFSGREITNSVATPDAVNIPEPASLMLMACGLAGIAVRRRK